VLATQVTGAHPLTPALLERIIAQTDGVPLVIEELTKAMLETAADHSPLALTVPATLQASLMARLDRLPARGKCAEALAHLEQALRLADGLGEGSDHKRLRLRLQITYGNARRTARGFAVPETQAAFTVARGLAAAVEDVSERFPAYFGL
jgi:hypothetical protein